ncbi:MAG TPA: urease accessory protein UreD [Candidatus Lumbricidophila sp.]|nr:urease accessory protein UreD [Candidatus Lumbricidophila sp.]
MLGGDQVRVNVTVAAGCALELEDIGGTVAYDGEGLPASWHVDIELGTGATLRWAGLPFVIADGADVTRTLHLKLADDSRATIRETLVLGRHGERGGRVVNVAQVTRAGHPELVESLELRGGSGVPGITGDHRVLDTVMEFPAANARSATDNAPTANGIAPATHTILELEAGGRIQRWLGAELHRSPLQQVAAEAG